MEEWRTYLYPLGFIASLAFSARFIVQWLESEKKHKSFVSPLFWQLSLIGNVMLLLHALIQLQYHITLIQTCNAVISWRNLDLMRVRSKPFSLMSVVLIMLSLICLMSTLFLIQNIWLDEGWFRTPIAPWHASKNSSETFDSIAWHLFGTLGFTLFSLRFWIQWVWVENTFMQSKRTLNSFSRVLEHLQQFPLLFWWLSICGSLLSMIYCIHIHDAVNLIGPVVGIIPYVRNLMLMYKCQKGTQEV